MTENKTEDFENTLCKCSHNKSSHFTKPIPEEKGLEPSRGCDKEGCDCERFEEQL